MKPSAGTIDPEVGLSQNRIILLDFHLVQSGTATPLAGVESRIERTDTMLAGRYLVAMMLCAPTAALGQKVPTQDWITVEADNGAIYGIDANSITPRSDNFHGNTFGIICRFDGRVCPLQNMSRWQFDCRGHYFDIDRRGGLMPAPPRSVAGRLAEIACSGGRRAKPAETAPKGRSASTFYESRYVLAGFLLRASRVCEGEGTRAIDAGFGLLDTEELKAISKAYPQQIAKWMEDGANKLNTGVMTDGVAAACSFAQKVMEQAEEMARADRR